MALTFKDITMIQIDGIIGRSFLAGVTIGIGGFINLSCDNHVVGALLFSICLLSICLLNLNLFTGKSGFIHDLSDFRRLVLVLIVNLLGAITFGIIIKFTDTSIVDSANKIVQTRLAADYSQLIIRSVITGFLMTLAVESEKKQDSNHIILVLSIMGFILSGCYHCIAETFYYSVSSLSFTDLFSVIARLSVVIVFNFIGCNLYNLIVTKKLFNRGT